jgi:hypothetical protein
MAPVFRLLILHAALLLSSTVHAGLPADVITVGPEGVANDCSAATLQEAIGIAIADPTRRRIWVRGSFAPEDVINAGSAIVIDTGTDTTLNLEITGGFPRVDGGPACSAPSPTGRTDYSGEGGAQDPVFRIRGGGTVTLKNLDISRGDADGDEGGGIDYRGNGALVVVNSVIGLNEARGTGSGGGISFRSSGGEANLVLSGTEVLQNSAQFGGGVIVFGTGRLTVNGSTINGNTARASGGGAYVRGTGGSVTVYLEQGVALSGNVAGDDGGGVYLANAALEWSGADGEMWLNAAADMGGGLYLTDGASADIYTRGRRDASGQFSAAIYANEARQGGGIAAAAFESRSPMRVRLTSHDGRNPQVIANNQASERGGAFFLKAYTSTFDSGWAVLCLRDTAVVNNRADRGSAIYSQRDISSLGSSSGSFLFVNIEVSGSADCPVRDSALTCPAGSECSEFTGNQSTTGAVIDLEAAGTAAWIARTKFVGNSGSTLVYAADASGSGTFASTRLISNLLALNAVSGSLLLSRGTKMWFLNNTVAANTLGAAVVDVRDWGNDLAVKRNIVIQPAQNAVNTNGQSPPADSITTNLTTDDGLSLIDPSNFNEDPQFDPGYRLQRTSPAVDRTILGASTPLDVAGDPRPVDLPDVPNVGGAADLGAYELQGVVFQDGFESL